MPKSDFQAREYAAEQALAEPLRSDWEADANKQERDFWLADFARAAMTGLCISHHLDTKEHLSVRAFDIAEAMLVEFNKRRAALND